MERLIRQVKKNIRRTPYQALAASMVMFLTFLTLLLFTVLAAGSQRVLSYYESKPQVIAFLKDNTTTEDIKAIQNALNLTGKITSLKYVSKEEALQRYKDRNKNDTNLLELVTASILPASLEISANSPSDLKPIAEILKKEPVVDDVAIPEDVIKSLTNAIVVVRSIGMVAVTFLALFSMLVILMVIGFKIRLKRTEIEIMKLLGASTWFIRAPFLLEGITYGLIGAVSSWAVTYILLWYFTPHLQYYLRDIPKEFINLPPNLLFMLGLLLFAILVAGILGSAGSFGAVRRYLRP